MGRSMISRHFQIRRRPAATRKNHSYRVRGIESLEDRRLLAVTASFSSTFQLLTVVGDGFDNNINIAREPDGRITVSTLR